MGFTLARQKLAEEVNVVQDNFSSRGDSAIVL